MNIKKIPAYIYGISKSLCKSRPRDLLKLLSNTPYIIEEIKEHNFSLILSVRDPAISKPLICTQQYETNITQTILKHLKEDIHFIDVGANLGFFSLLVSKHCPNACVWSFEPDHDNFRLFKASIALNNLEKQIKAYPLAASNEDETLFFSDLGYKDNLGSRFTAKNRNTLESHSINKNTPCNQIKAVRLDSLLKDEQIDLVKMDIEGYEPFAFQGMRNIIENYRPIIITEFAPGTIEHISQTDPVSLLEFFIEQDYQLNIIEKNSDIINLGSNPDLVMNYFSHIKSHHIDLLLKPSVRGQVSV